eukprot:m.412884 g.412884  ORF g.412884 m.412884 type:complete len:145 (+) comp28970_c0_seq1:167-601(+)
MCARVSACMALKFFDGSETGKGWDECSKYVVSAEAPFEGQFVGSLSGLKTIKDYVGFTHGCTIAMPNCKSTPWFVGVDEERRCVCINANFEATHTAECEGFPPPTNKSAKCEFSYTLWFDEAGKIIKMNKLWNDQWSMVALGWA